LPLQGGHTVPVQNTYAYGNAWFVDKVTYVDNANQELDALKRLNLRRQAVADEKFREVLGESVPQGEAVARLTVYKPNNLTYEVKSDKGGVLVFSEIYYPGWTVTIDGQPAELGRVNYVLRALQVRPGSHKIVLDFHPTSVRKTETVAYVGYAVLLLLVFFAVFMEWRKRKEDATVE
ncbi:YfhO family protein, partial [Segatella buccae]|uniref:YfhO family protein n=1 Tax=Segatella buccae TaxID=28126 RepID=UPI00128C3574